MCDTNQSTACCLLVQRPVETVLSLPSVQREIFNMGAKGGICLLVLVAIAHSAIGAEEISNECVACICEAMSGCNLDLKCVKATCGPFRLSWGYWADAGKPTLEDQDSEDQTAYSDCAVDPACAISTVQGYMSRFAQDCNNDGVIDCEDYMMIHVHGGYGCNAKIPAKYANKFAQCKP